MALINKQDFREGKGKCPPGSILWGEINKEFKIGFLKSEYDKPCSFLLDEIKNELIKVRDHLKDIDESWRNRLEHIEINSFNVVIISYISY